MYGYIVLAVIFILIVGLLYLWYISRDSDDSSIPLHGNCKQTPNNCGSNLVCDSDVCKQPLDSPCSHNVDCASPYVCLNGRCAEAFFLPYEDVDHFRTSKSEKSVHWSKNLVEYSPH